MTKKKEDTKSFTNILGKLIATTFMIVILLVLFGLAVKFLEFLFN